MRRTNIVYCGDSVMADTHNTPGVDDIPLLASPTMPFIWSNRAVGGSTVDEAGQGTQADSDYKSSVELNICFVEFGLNDMVSSDGATFVATLKTFCLARISRGFRVVVCTTTPSGIANGISRARTANGLIKADTSFWHALADYGVDSGTTMGADAACLDSSLYQVDQIHPTPLGNSLIAPIVSVAGMSLIVPPLYHVRQQTVRVDGL